MNSAGQRALLLRVARAAMIERGMEPDFPPAELAEVAQLSPATPQPNGEICDLRELLWCSIDNDDSRDLDQLTVAETLDSGPARVRVAVADVSALVEAGSAVDDHAATNTTSVYTPAQVFSMLPERLSTDLTSLVQDEDRLAIVVEIVVDAEGQVQSSELYRAVVRNRAKLAY